MRRFLGAVLGLGLMLSTTTVKADVKVGDKAPDFSLQGSDGKTYKLADFKGKQAVVVAWYPKAFTGGCTIECKNFREKGDVLKKSGAAYFTASVDTPELNEKFGKSLEIDYPILSDPTKEVAKAYGVLNPTRGVAQRWTFYIDKDGVIREIDKMVKPATSAQDVASTLKKLGLAE